MPTLRHMCGPGQTPAVTIYSRMGGALWLMGGGVAYNSTMSYNVKSNDVGTMVFSSAAGELVPGRVMYDVAQWSSEISLRQPTAVERNPALAATWPGAPDYSALPPRLDARAPETDPVPPERSAELFYPASFAGEVLSKPDPILEDTGDDPDHPVVESVLDTLYFGAGGDVGTAQPIMTYYHGRAGGPTVVSGFPLWYFQRSQAIQLADFVLQRIWGLPRAALPR